jgi:uncharacterized protein YydD (DUF2326 family)
MTVKYENTAIKAVRKKSNNSIGNKKKKVRVIEKCVTVLLPREDAFIHLGCHEGSSFESDQKVQGPLRPTPYVVPRAP